MTLRSRLSAAWKAFKRDDFPPTTITGVTSNLNLDSSAYTNKLEHRYGDRGIDFSRPPSIPPVDMSPHPLPSAVDESKLTPDYSNLEVPTVLRKRRKKLESVKK